MRTCLRDTRTGAPLTLLVVNTAAVAHGTSETIRARAGLPLGLMPQVPPAARKPRGTVMLVGEWRLIMVRIVRFSWSGYSLDLLIGFTSENLGR